MCEHTLPVGTVLEVLYSRGRVDEVVIWSEVQIECLLEGGESETERVRVTEDGGVEGERTLAIAVS